MFNLINIHAALRDHWVLQVLFSALQSILASSEVHNTLTRSNTVYENILNLLYSYSILTLSGLNLSSSRQLLTLGQCSVYCDCYYQSCIIRRELQYTVSILYLASKAIYCGIIAKHWPYIAIYHRTLHYSLNKHRCCPQHISPLLVQLFNYFHYQINHNFYVMAKKNDVHNLHNCHLFTYQVSSS